MSAELGITYGPAPESHNSYCNFAPGPNAPSCLAPATWHGLILTEDCSALENVTFCCDRHLPSMRLSVDFIHAHDTACGLPGGRCMWDGSDGTSYCYIDWDTSALKLAAAEPVTA